jgi:hypothetical protein
MHRYTSRILWLIAVSFLLILTAGIASAATETYKISYSGKLTSATGSALTGTYNVTFRLYTVASGGAPLATDAHNVTASGGQFTTTLTFPAANYNGQQLYVSLQRSPDPEKARTAVYPVPYALGLRPGAVIQGNAATNPSLRVLNTGSNSAALVAGTTGQNSPALFAAAEGQKSPGVFALSTNDAGVYGRGKEGGYFTTTSGGTAFDDLRTGVNISTSNTYNPGLFIRTKEAFSEGIIIESKKSTGVQVNSDDGIGVWVLNVNNVGVFGESKNGFGMVGQSDEKTGVAGISKDQAGVSGDSTNYIGVLGRASAYPGVEGQSTDNPGVHGTSTNDVGVLGEGTSAAGVHGTSTSKAGVWGVSANDVGIYGETSRADHMYGVLTRDYMSAARYDTNAGDIAEYMDATEHVLPGTVMIIGEDGKLTTSVSAYDTRVAGIVSTTPGVALGIKAEGNPGEEILAVAGRVPCRADAQYGAIHPGDILTTSDNPGYAMKARPVNAGGVEIYKPATVLGKAMGSLESGTGTIDVLVTLQ